MKAGRELDALIATEAMKWELSTNGEVWVDKESGECIRDVDDWRPSDPDGIADAWLVLEMFPGNVIAVARSPYHFLSVGGVTVWDCTIGKIGAEADTAPLAICLAALEAVENK